MKLRTAITALMSVYLGLSIVGAVFYLVADFGKSLTLWVGILWLFLLCAEVMIVVLGKKNHVISPLLIAIMTAMQIPILYTWVSLNGAAVFYLFSATLKVGLYGVIFHGFLLLSGVVIALQLRKGNNAQS